MFDNLGIQWAGTLLGCLAAAMVPIPICFYIFGKKLRAKSKFAPTMKSKPDPAEDGESEDDSVADDHDHPNTHFVALQGSRSHAFDEPRVTTNGTQQAGIDRC